MYWSGRVSANVLACFTVRKSAAKTSIASGLGFSDYSHYTIAFGIKCIYRSKQQTVAPPFS